VLERVTGRVWRGLVIEVMATKGITTPALELPALCWVARKYNHCSVLKVFFCRATRSKVANAAGHPDANRCAMANNDSSVGTRVDNLLNGCIKTGKEIVTVSCSWHAHVAIAGTPRESRLQVCTIRRVICSHLEIACLYLVDTG
jgi:hypothetical protein